MYCPNCGKQTLIDQKFCRACGMSLLVVAEAIVAHQATDDSGTLSVEKDKRALRRMAFRLFWGIAILFLGAGVLGVSKRMFPNDLVWLLGLLMVLAGTLISAYAVISPLWQQSKLLEAPIAKRRTGLEDNIQTLPEGLPAPPPSITEQTTTRLESEAAKTQSGDIRKTT
jgi:hypothetical protein